MDIISFAVMKLSCLLFISITVNIRKQTVIFYHLFLFIDSFHVLISPFVLPLYSLKLMGFFFWYHSLGTYYMPNTFTHKTKSSKQDRHCFHLKVMNWVEMQLLLFRWKAIKSNFEVLIVKIVFLIQISFSYFHLDNFTSILNQYNMFTDIIMVTAETR